MKKTVRIGLDILVSGVSVLVGVWGVKHSVESVSELIAICKSRKELTKRIYALAAQVDESDNEDYESDNTIDGNDQETDVEDTVGE